MPMRLFEKSGAPHDQHRVAVMVTRAAYPLRAILYSARTATLVARRRSRP